MRLHCWEDRGAWAAETFGLHTAEYFAAYPPGEGSATCMLERGHDGPHEWTSDGDIQVTFVAAPTPEG